MCYRYFLISIATTMFIACEDGNPNRFSATGIVEGTAIKVAAQVGGQILQMPVEEGELVEANHTIAVLDTEKLVYQMEAIDAGLDEIGVQLEISRNTLETAASNFENAKTKYQRYRELYEKNSASKQVLDDLKTAYDASKNQLDNSEQNVRLVESKKKGLLAQRKLLQRQLQDAIVTSPITGTLTSRFYEPGETIIPGQPVAEVIDLEKMWTRIYVSEQLLPGVHVGESVKVRVDGTDQVISGRTSWISAQAEFTPKTILTKESRTALVYAVKVDIDNPDNVLKHGMPVEIELDLKE